MKDFFFKLIKNAATVFSWPNLLWHLLAVVLTYITLVTGLDWKYFSITRVFNPIWWMPAAILGGLLPLLVPLGLYLVGKIRKNLETIIVSKLLLQAAMLGSFISSLYKAFTGRIPPDYINTVTDVSHGFRFGFWEGGIFWGWPSSHTTIAFAMVFALITYSPENKWIRYVGIIYATYIGLGASVGFHWFSEFIAGFIFGTLIGFVVGKSFKKS